MSIDLPANTVDVWQWDLDQVRWDGYAWVLCETEKTKAQRFYSELLQLRYRRCRARLRVLLAQYLTQPAESLIFTYNDYGKPALVNGGLEFNLSHCDNWAMLAVSHEAVGIDIEASARAKIEIASLMDIVCHPLEKVELKSLTTKHQEAAFYRLWTQKEAYCKALGNGLQRDLTSIRFLPVDDHFQVEDKEAIDPMGFRVCSLPAPHGYLASLCSRATQVQIRIP